MSTQLRFEKAKEERMFAPLPQYYEEIYANQIGIRELGLRGDENYLFYAVDGHGAGYYEEREKELSAASVYDFFQDPANRTNFFKRIDRAIETLVDWSAKIEAIELDSLSVIQLAEYFLKVNQLHGLIFSLYIVSQPYRMVRFEEQLKGELVKRVATSRLDLYAVRLAASNKPTKLSEEELSWLRFVIRTKTTLQGAKLDTTHLEKTHPHIYRSLVRHFDEYKTLTLGDGNWKFDFNHFLVKLKRDYSAPLEQLESQYKTAKERPKLAEAKRQQLIEDLYLDEQTRQNIDFLSEIGHTRLVMRINGWVPFVRTIIKVDIALSDKLGFAPEAGQLLNYLTEDEIKHFIATGVLVPVPELVRRMGARSEFLILNSHGTFKIYYGTEAGRKFRELVPPTNHAAVTELHGATAVLGKITGKVCVYKWGDDIAAKTEEIKHHPILIAGQTRPQMMSMIRLAKGIVTDEGGITSHAAIVSRELGIPSVIGTIHATSVFQSGDLAELDANSGVVRKLT